MRKSDLTPGTIIEIAGMYYGIVQENMKSVVICYIKNAINEEAIRKEVPIEDFIEKDGELVMVFRATQEHFEADPDFYKGSHLKVGDILLDLEVTGIYHLANGLK